jgi:rod shape-determining protein MreC
MYVLRRWWGRHWVRVLIISLAIAGAWGMRQSRAAFVTELYGAIARPFRGDEPSLETVLTHARVLELQQRVTELETQNRQLKTLLNYQSTTKTTGIVAPVIGRSADHWWQHMILGRGRRDGIEVGAIVTAPGGLVGRVVDVTPSTSRILLVSDGTSRVGVAVSRSRAMGYMRGQNETRVVMEFFDKLPDVKPGDEIVTSAYSQLFPPGVPIGKVESIDLKNGPAPEAEIALTVPLDRLEWVTVQPYTPKKLPIQPVAPVTENELNNPLDPVLDDVPDPQQDP